MHPLSIAALRLTAVSRLGSGDPAAPENDYLPLLPSGPDGVRRFSPRRTQSSTPLSRRSPTMPDLEREFNPAVADCGYRAPLVPRLARPLILPNGPPNVKQIARDFTQRRKGFTGGMFSLTTDANPHNSSSSFASLRLCVKSLTYAGYDRRPMDGWGRGGILGGNYENAAGRECAPRKEPA